MSAEELVRRWTDAANRHDAAAVAADYADDAVVYDPQYAEPLRGRAAIQKDFEDFVKAFPDLHFEVRNVMESADTVAGEFSVKGTHTGPLPLPSGEIPATGKSLTFDGAVFSRTNSEGKVVEERRYYDLAGQMQQLGLTS